jgi:hypothetical protein
VTPPPVTPPPVTPPPAPTGLAQIKGTVYNDANGNGVKDWDELGLPGWTIQLSGTVSGTTVTDVNGDYSFVALPIGDYKACTVVQATWTQTAPATGPACTSGLGWALNIPANLPDLWWTNVNFGVWVAPAPTPLP